MLINTLRSDRYLPFQVSSGVSKNKPRANAYRATGSWKAGLGDCDIAVSNGWWFACFVFLVHAVDNKQREAAVFLKIVPTTRTDSHSVRYRHWRVVSCGRGGGEEWKLRCLKWLFCPTAEARSKHRLSKYWAFFRVEWPYLQYPHSRRAMVISNIGTSRLGIVFKLCKHLLGFASVPLVLLFFYYFAHQSNPRLLWERSLRIIGVARLNNRCACCGRR